MADLAQARAAKRLLRAQLEDLGVPAAVGLTRCPDGYQLQVDLTTDSRRSSVPTSVDGVQVCVRLTGPIRAQA